MNAEKRLRASLNRLTADERAGVHHLALFGALTRMWKDSKYASSFAINQQRLKEASKLRSVNACDQALRELDEWEYLRYFPRNAALSNGHRCGNHCGRRMATPPNLEVEGLVCLSLPGVLSSKAPRRRRLTSRVVMPRVISSQTALFPDGESEMTKSAVGMKIVQLAVQAVIQLAIALLNKHLDLF